MIEINLSTKGKENDLTNVGGINLSLLNVKFLFLGLVLVYALEPIIDIFYQGDIDANNALIKENKTKHQQLVKELRKYDSVKNQVEELEEQRKKLKAKINVVREIVEMRQNPFAVMKYVAENTPPNVWLVDLEIDKRDIKLTGYSTSWKSIGDYIENLKSSIFFNGSVSYSKPEGLKSKLNKKRVESFEITTQIVGF